MQALDPNSSPLENFPALKLIGLPIRFEGKFSGGLGTSFIRDVQRHFEFFFGDKILFTPPPSLAADGFFCGKNPARHPVRDNPRLASANGGGKLFERLCFALAQPAVPDKKNSKRCAHDVALVRLGDFLTLTLKSPRRTAIKRLAPCSRSPKFCSLHSENLWVASNFRGRSQNFS